MNTDPLHIIIYGIVFACVYVCGGGEHYAALWGKEQASKHQCVSMSCLYNTLKFDSS